MNIQDQKGKRPHGYPYSDNEKLARMVQEIGWPLDDGERGPGDV